MPKSYAFLSKKSSHVYFHSQWETVFIIAITITLDKRKHSVKGWE